MVARFVFQHGAGFILRKKKGAPQVGRASPRNRRETAGCAVAFWIADLFRQLPRALDRQVRTFQNVSEHHCE